MLKDLGLILRLAYVGPSEGDCVVRKIRQVGTGHLVEDNEVGRFRKFSPLREVLAGH